MAVVILKDLGGDSEVGPVAEDSGASNSSSSSSNKWREAFRCVHKCMPAIAGKVAQKEPALQKSYLMAGGGEGPMTLSSWFSGAGGAELAA